MGLRFSPSLKQALGELAAADRRPLATCIELVLEDHVERSARPPARGSEPEWSLSDAYDDEGLYPRRSWQCGYQERLSCADLSAVHGYRKDTAKPEAAYFVADGGERTAYFFFDLKQPADIPPIAEPFFSTLHAAVDVTPAMNIEDVKSGLGALKA